MGGWARMALPVHGLSVTEVAKPNLGERVPALVHAEIKVDLGTFSGDMRDEWEELREHDVLFLVSAKPKFVEGFLGGGGKGGGGKGGGGKGGKGKGGKGGGGKGKGKGKGGRRDEDAEDLALAKRWGITAVRGCEVGSTGCRRCISQHPPQKKQRPSIPTAFKGTLHLSTPLSTPCLQHCAGNNGMRPVHVQVYGMTDEDGVSLNDPLQPDTRKHGRAGDGRTLKVHEATHTRFRGILVGHRTPFGGSVLEGNRENGMPKRGGTGCGAPARVLW